MTKAAKLRALLNRPGLAAAAGSPWVRAAVPPIPYSPPEIRDRFRAALGSQGYWLTCLARGVAHR